MTCSPTKGPRTANRPKLIITVLPETRVIDDVETRVIEERESADGQLVEVSRNYYAIAKKTHDVYYFGEDVETYKDGKVDGHPGIGTAASMARTSGCSCRPSRRSARSTTKSWHEGGDGSLRDRQRDRESKGAAGSFDRCVKTKETTPLEPSDTEYKLYAPGVGLLVDGGLKLVSHTMRN